MSTLDRSDLKQANRSGAQAASDGRKYDACPYEVGDPRRLSWSEGHNAQRAANFLRKSEAT